MVVVLSTLMFLQLKHTKLDVYRVSRKLVLISYQLAKTFPTEEKFALCSQIRRASTSVLLNLSEGCSKHSEKERNRFYETARGSVVELDTAFTLAVDLEYIKIENTADLKIYLNKCFQMLSKMIKFDD